MMSDEEIDRDIEAADGDMNAVFTGYKNQFLTHYNQSIHLFNQEKEQRQLLHYYQRRNNALVDIIAEAEGFDGDKEMSEEEMTARLDNLKSMNPSINMAGDVNLQTKISLLLDESILELEVDDLIHLEKNPQDIEFWLRRNKPNLVLSRFKPVMFEDNKLVKIDSNLDNLNNSLNNNVHTVSTKRKKK